MNENMGQAPAPAPPQQPPYTPQRMSALAIVAFVLSLLFFIPLVSLVGAILGIVAVVRISKDATLGGLGLAIAAIPTGLVLFLFWTAIAIPAFVKYVRKSKTVEATEALDKIKYGAREYFVMDHWDQNGTLMKKQFPKSISLTPSGGPPCDAAQTPTSEWDAAGWGNLHFGMMEPHRYAYEFISAGLELNAVYTARALGDLDCDGNHSTYEFRGRVDAEGDVIVVGPIITNEIE